jgi:hypothetical protein
MIILHRTPSEVACAGEAYPASARDICERMARDRFDRMQQIEGVLFRLSELSRA